MLIMSVLIISVHAEVKGTLEYTFHSYSAATLCSAVEENGAVSMIVAVCLPWNLIPKEF